MRIAMLAPLEIRVPPLGYGGTELVVSLLTEELVRQGHDVTLFASGDSQTAAKLVPGSEHFLRDSGRDSQVLGLLNATSCFERADDFDIIHNHTCPEGLALAGLVKTPVLSTLHGGLSGDSRLLFERYQGFYNTISWSAKKLLPARDRFAGVIYNAIDCESHPFNSGPRDDYLLYISRISREKGTHIAIDVARRLGAPLIIAGNIHASDLPYFQSEVEPFIDGHQIRYVGEANQLAKRELMKQARCLLAPITWDEPFGLFMIEAMACGTAVIAMNRGSVPEVIEDGVTGFIVTDVEEMCVATSWLNQIDPLACRKHVEERFHVRRMATDYLSAYSSLLAVAEPCPAPNLSSLTSHAWPSALPSSLDAEPLAV